jgi:hypothetical protein
VLSPADCADLFAPTLAVDAPLGGITVVRQKSLNKSYALADDGSVSKSDTKHPSNARAIVRQVADARSMRDLLESIGDDPDAILVTGVPVGFAAGYEFRLASQKNETRIAVPGLRTTTRTKERFVATGWLLLDRDNKGVEPEIAELSTPDWLKRLADDEVLPGITNAHLVIARSGSARIRKLDGTPALPIEAHNAHVWVCVANPADVERLKGDGALRTRLSEYGVDTAVWDRAHSVFSGCPTAGDGLFVAPQEVQVVEDGLFEQWDTSQVKTTRGLLTAGGVGTQAAGGTDRIGLTLDQGWRVIELYPNDGVQGDQEYDPWLRDMAAIHHEFGGAGEEMAREWSMKSLDKHKEPKFRSTWGSFHRTGKGSGSVATFAGLLGRLHAARPEVFGYFDTQTCKWVDGPLGDVWFVWQTAGFEVIERTPDEIAADAVASAKAAERARQESRPEIRIRAGERGALVAELAQLLANRAPYYRRDGMLVRAAMLPADEVADGMQRRRGAVLLRAPKIQAVIADASHVARVTVWDKRAMKFVPTDIPEGLASAFCELGVEQEVLPPIIGVVQCPIMREDGSLHTQAGYDRQSRMILTGGENWRELEIPAHPTRDDALKALSFLTDGPYRDFPYADDVSQSVAISALLTAVIRPAVDCVPLHAFSAPQYGAGKSLQATLAAIAATGVQPSMLAPGHSQEEFEKRIDAAIIAGDPVVVLDNISRSLTGDNFCMALTSNRATVRPLGSSVQQTVPTSAFWMATGQNLSVAKDMQRRTVVSYIDARVERPENRDGFAIPNLVEWAIKHRMEILSAAFTMLRAHALAGFPDGGEKPLGSFEQWSRRVAHCLVWLGLPNPVQSQQRLRDEDPQVLGRTALFRALYDWQQTLTGEQRNGWTLRDVKQAFDETLEETIAEVLPKGVSSMTWWLRTNRNVTVDVDGRAVRLESVGVDRTNTAKWLLR